MRSAATTVAAYLDSLPADRRATLAAVREAILGNLGEGFEEGMQYGMIGYYVPHRIFPAGYHTDPKQPVPFAALASQKGHCSLYLMGSYCGCVGPDGETDEARWLRKAWAATGKKLDMGKACIRFQRLDQVPLALVGEAIRRLPLELFLRQYEDGLAQAQAAKAAKKSAATKSAATKSAATKSAATKSAATKSAAKKSAAKKSAPAAAARSRKARR